MLTKTQEQFLSLFQKGEYRELLRALHASPGKFPQKQFPVIGFGVYGKPGTFGCRTSNTTFAVPNDDSYITFTIGVLGTLTLNLHAPSVDSVDWINGTIAQQWVYKAALPQKDADQLVIWAQSSLMPAKA